MRDDHPPRQPADPDRRRGAGQQEAPFRRRRLRPDQERQAAQVHPPKRNITWLIAKNVHTRVACSGQIHWFIARHAPDRRAPGRSDPVNFGPAPRPIMHFSWAPSPMPAWPSELRSLVLGDPGKREDSLAMTFRDPVPLMSPARRPALLRLGVGVAGLAGMAVSRARSVEGPDGLALYPPAGRDGGLA